MVKIKDMKLGDDISFGGLNWTVLNPTTGFLIYKSSLQRAFSTAGGNDVYSVLEYDQTLPTSIAYYLNNDFYNAMTTQARDKIKNTSWSMNTYLSTGPQRPNVITKIGIISESEHNLYYNRFDTVNYLKAIQQTTRSIGRQYSDQDLTGYGPYGENVPVLPRAVTSFKPVMYVDSEVDVTSGVASFNQAPTVTVATTNARTLYENDTYGINGTATDTDSGNVISVKYQINAGAIRAISTQISTGAAFPYSKSLTFKAGALYDGATAVTPALAEGTQHVLKVWAEDDQGGKSVVVERTFYVVPNRPAVLTINPFSSATDLIDSDKITIGGNVSDPDGNTVVVKYKIANGAFTEVHSGFGAPFTFQISLSSLVIGVNTITVQAVDFYGAITNKTLQITKSGNVQPLLKSDARYKLTPPNGSAKGIVLWIERDVGDLVVDAQISMGANGAAENFVAMTKHATAFVSTGREEDEYRFESDTPKENIILKLGMTRTNIASNKDIRLLSGVLS